LSGTCKANTNKYFRIVDMLGAFYGIELTNEGLLCMIMA